MLPGCCTSIARPVTLAGAGSGASKQALLTLVHLRKNETFSQLGTDFGVSQATAWRYADETLDVLADWAPDLHEALTGLGEGDHVIVDSRPDLHRPHPRG